MQSRHGERHSPGQRWVEEDDLLCRPLIGAAERGHHHHPLKKSGVITFHTLFPVSLLKSQEGAPDTTDATETTNIVLLPSARPKCTSGCYRVGKSQEESSCKQKRGATQDWLSHTSLRLLQATIEAENQQARKITEPLLDGENGFVKELESFLSQWDVTQLRRKELLHKRWTERVWIPLQMRVEEHVSSHGPAEAKRRQSLYSQYINQCTKGFVFLETYDPKEYDPFLNIKDAHCKLHENQEEQRMPPCNAGCKNTKSQETKLPERDHSLIQSVMSQTKTSLQTSSYYSGCGCRKPAPEDETEVKETSRLNTIPYHIMANARADGICHHPSCWSSRGLQQLQSLATSK